MAPDWEASPHLLGIAADRPAFLNPCVRVLLRDDVHELAAADIVGNEMTTGADPLRMAVRLQCFAWHVFGFEKRAPYHLTRIGRVVSAIERLADHGTHTIRSDNVLSLNASAVCELQGGPIGLLFNA